MSTTIDLHSENSFVPEAASFPDVCVPPEAEYQSREELVKAINTWAAARGYAFIARRSATKSSGRKIVTYACDRSWPAEVSTGNESKRKTTTRGTSCPFPILAKDSLDKMTWSYTIVQTRSTPNVIMNRVTILQLTLHIGNSMIRVRLLCRSLYRRASLRGTFRPGSP